MKRKDFYQLISPLSEKLYRFAYNIIPDDLQAEQLVVDGLTAYLLKEKKHILHKNWDPEDKKGLPLLRRFYFKGIIGYMSEIGARRSVQLTEQMRLSRSTEFMSFYSLEPKARIVLTLRYDFQFTVVEIEDTLKIPRYEVIEKLHNGRFILMNQLNEGALP